MARTSDKNFQQVVSTLFFAANTSDVIKWDKLRAKLDTAPLPLSNRGYCSLLVDAANRKKLSGTKWNQLVGLQIQKNRDQDKVALREDVRDGLADVLNLMAEGTNRDRAAIREQVGKVVQRSVVLVPTWTATGRRDQLIATGIPGAIAYGIHLLSTEFDGLLCRCQYSKCRKFFFKRKGKGGRGARRRKYCTTKHGELGDREKAAERMRQKRRKP